MENLRFFINYRAIIIKTVYYFIMFYYEEFSIIKRKIKNRIYVEL